MNRKGLCQLKFKHICASDFSKVVYKITEENVSVLKEYFKATSDLYKEKIEVGDLITKDLSLFDKNGTPKSFKDDRIKYEYDTKKDQIVAVFKTIYKYVFIETEEEVKILQKIGFPDAKKGCVMIIAPDRGFPYKFIISKKQFQKEYKIVEEK